MSSDPHLIVGLLIIGVPLFAFAAATGFMVGLWRLVWHGGQRQRDLARRERGEP